MMDYESVAVEVLLVVGPPVVEVGRNGRNSSGYWREVWEFLVQRYPEHFLAKDYPTNTSWGMDVLVKLHKIMLAKEGLVPNE